MALSQRVSRRQFVGLAATAMSGLAGASTAAGTAAAATGTPRRGGSITMTVSADWIDMDPHKNGQFASMFAWEQTYQSLVTFDDKLNILPDLALSWQNPDPLTYIFKLRPNVRFHNGDPFTADDVAYWHQRLSDPATAAPYKSWFPIAKVEAVDPLTAKFALTTAFSPLLANMASMRGSAIVPHKWAATANLAKEAIGTGPYKLTQVSPKNSYRWEINKEYWDSSVPYIDTAENKLLLEEAARLAAIESGASSYTWLSGESTQQLTNRSLNVMISDKAYFYQLQFNCSRSPFKDKRVRQAVGFAVNHQDILDKAAGGFGTLTGPLPTGFRDWYIPPDKLTYKFDLKQAKQLLAAAGFPNGFKTTYKANSSLPEDVATGQILKQQLKTIGIDVEIMQLDTTTWVSQTQPPKSDFDMRMNIDTFYPDPDGYLYNKYYSTSGFNQTRFNSPQLDQFVTKAREVSDLTDHAQRRQIYMQVQQLLLDELPAIPLWNGKNIEVLSPKLQGYRQSYTGRRLFFPDTWLAE